jgi:hypothetical protein
MMLSRVDLPDPRRAQQDHELPFRQRQRHVAQGRHFDLADVIGLGQVAKVEDWWG